MKKKFIERPKSWGEKIAREYIEFITNGDIELLVYETHRTSTFKCNKCNREFKGNFWNTLKYIERNGRVQHDCNKVSKFEKMTAEKFMEKVKQQDDIEDGEYIFLEPFIDYNTHILCHHTKCNHKWKVRPSHFTGTMKTRCPNCRQKTSKGEREIRKWLDKHEILYKYYYMNDDLGRRSFDFMLIDEDGNPLTAIEFNGEKHYKKKFKMTDKDFQNQIENDKFKEKYCKDNGIYLLIIKYNEVNKIDEILSNTLNII